jgi:hypothetical protein
MRDNTAPRVAIPTGREVEAVPVRLVWNRESRWDRLRRRLRVIASYERFREGVVVVITFTLVGVFVTCLHHAIRAPSPPAAYAFGVVPALTGEPKGTDP